MPALRHVYVTAHGEYTDAAWIGEKAQFGLRIVIADEAALPAKGSTFTVQDNGDVAQDSGTNAGTHGTLTRTWTARLGAVGSTENADAAWQTDLAEDFWTFLNGITSSQFSGFKWTHVKLAPVLSDGSYGAPAATYTFTSPMVGTGTGAVLPPQLSLAVTLRAPVIGRRGRGRFYLPALTSTNGLETNGTVKSSWRSNIVSQASTLISNIENAPGTEVQTPLVAVMSANSQTAVRPTQVRVGSKWDTQRRRAQQVPETYTDLGL